MPDTTLPRAARFACWYAAYAEGRTSLDDALSAITGEDGAHHVAGLDDPGGTDVVPLALALGGLRRRTGGEVGVALPAPGDPVGLTGPPVFTAEAVDAGEAVLLPSAGLGLVPHKVGAGVTWVAHPAATPPAADLGEADRGLRVAVREAASALADLDLARWQPEAADELMNLRQPPDLPLPDGMLPPRMALIATACRCRHIVALAMGDMADDGGAVTAAQSDQRRDALRPLDRAARRALVAACSTYRDR